jgi:hypothetical protein
MVLHFTPHDYYLWGAIKGELCKHNPHTLLELKEATENFIRKIHPI